MFLIKSFNEKDEDVVVVISDIIEQIKQCEKLYLQDRLSQAVELLRLIDIKLENLNSEMRIAVLGEMNKSTKLTVLRKEGG